MSTLNPYASSYIPLSERRKQDDRNRTAFTKPPSENYEEVRGNHLPGTGEVSYISKELNSQDWTLKGHRVPGLHASQSRNVNDLMEKLNMDDEAEMDLDYLAVIFPGMSNQSLADVYHASGGDLEASVDMLNHLELPVDLRHQLPDTLDIGNLADYGSPTEGTTAILKRTISGETSGSSSFVASK